jgi:hypothetical protein
VVDAEDDLHVPVRVLPHNRHCVLGSHDFLPVRVAGHDGVDVLELRPP